MVHSVRRPVILTAQLCSSSAPSFSVYPFLFRQQQQRPFSQQAPRCVSMRNIQDSMKPQRSLGRNLKSLLKEGGSQVRDEIGFLPKTFVTPTRSNIPSIFRHSLDYLYLRYKHIRTRLTDRALLLAFKYSSPRTTSIFRRRLKLRRSQIIPAALAMHREMYAAFAEGDTKSLRKLCTDGIYDNFVARIKARRKGEAWRWELVEYNRVGLIRGGGARLVSCRGATIGMEGTGVIQAVVRIRSRQKLTRYKEDGTVVDGTGKEKDVEELVVVQRFVREWVSGDWKIWGMVGETTIQDLRNWANEGL